jgi:outer membrane protein W
MNNKDFVGVTSANGFKIESRHFLNENISVGGEISWNSLYEYTPTQTYQIENGAVTTDLFKYMYNVPFVMNAHYYFGSNSIVMPYAGLAAGGMYSEQYLYLNIHEITGKNWGFVVRPEAGAIIKFGSDSNMAALLGIRYNYATNHESKFNIRSIQTLGFQLGLAFLR